MSSRKTGVITTVAVPSLLFALSCGQPLAREDGGGDVDGIPRSDGWTEESHGKSAEPAYDLLFDDTIVHRLDIAIAPTDFEAMQEDMTAKYGPFGGGGATGPPPPEAIEACASSTAGSACSYESGGATWVGVCRPPPVGVQGPLLCVVNPDGVADEDPIFIPVTVGYGGASWWSVGMRYKGNSSLRSAWQQGIGKLAFRLDFDEFEETYPEIDDQRFWGFKKMTFSNGFKDRSLMRDKLAADIFREAGVPAAHGSFCRVYVDVGDGPVYWGLYTMIEDPSNRLLDTQFADDSGNLYKPDGEGATWRTFIQRSFVKKTNQEAGDWSDIGAAIAALHDRNQTPENWRAGLDAVFDVAGFMRYLAVNTIGQNWDAYGRMPHNYYLYSDPSASGRLVWIPWDLNEALTRGGGVNPPLSLSFAEVGVDWPLIRYLIDDPSYRAAYEDALAAVLAGAFAVEPLRTRMMTLHEMIAPYAIGVDGEIPDYTFLTSPDQFEEALDSGPDALIPHVEARVQATVDYLAGQ